MSVVTRRNGRVARACLDETGFRSAIWLFVVFAASVLSACATFSEPFAVSIKNDLDKTVVMKVCQAHDCSTTGDVTLLRPGHVGESSVELKSGNNSVVIVDLKGAIIGCLPFRLDHRPSHDIRVSVSQAVRCGTSGGARAVGNRDWPNSND